MTNSVRLAEYARGLADAARELASAEFDHVFFDLQNELSGGWTRLSRQDVRTLAGAVRATDRSRLLSASDFDPDPGRQVALVRDAKLDILNFHDSPRDERWPGHTAELVASFTSALAGEKLAIPVYAGEPPPEAHGHGASAFARSLEGARARWGGRVDVPHAGRVQTRRA